MIRILKGKKTLNDWFCLELSINNFINFELSLFGYGVKTKIMIYNSHKSSKEKKQ